MGRDDSLHATCMREEWEYFSGIALKPEDNETHVICSRQKQKQGQIYSQYMSWRTRLSGTVISSRSAIMRG